MKINIGDKIEVRTWSSDNKEGIVKSINIALDYGDKKAEKELIEFKEAIIFGFLGACRLTLQPTSLSSVTGAIRNSCGGVIHIPN